MTNEELARQLAFPPGSEPRQKAEFELRLQQLNAQTEATKAQREAVDASVRSAKAAERAAEAGVKSTQAAERSVMQQDEMIATLQRYKRELEGVLSRFIEVRNDIYIGEGDDAKFRQMVLELRDLFDDQFVDGRRHSRQLIEYFNESISNFVGSPSRHGVEQVKNVVASALTRVERNPLVLKTTAAKEPKYQDVIVRIAERLHLVVHELRQRRERRPTLDVADEYDVQDLIHALLRLYFDDIRPEEWTPSHAGASSRMDFFLPEIEAVLEVKMTRPNLSTKQLGEQLILDIAKYKEHPKCRTLFCLVYDPDKRIRNPLGLESDLNKKHSDDRMVVRTMIVPR